MDHESLVAHLESLGHKNVELIHPDEIDGIQTEDDAISAFSGGAAAIGELEFGAAAFWRHTGKTGLHGQHIYSKLRALNATTAALIEEYSK